MQLCYCHRLVQDMMLSLMQLCFCHRHVQDMMRPPWCHKHILPPPVQYSYLSRYIFLYFCLIYLHVPRLSLVHCLLSIYLNLDSFRSKDVSIYLFLSIDLNLSVPWPSTFYSSVFMSVCLSAYPLYLSITNFLYIYLCVYLSTYLCFQLSVCLSVYLFIYLSLCLSVHYSIYLSVCVYLTYSWGDQFRL